MDHGLIFQSREIAASRSHESGKMGEFSTVGAQVSEFSAQTPGCSVFLNYFRRVCVYSMIRSVILFWFCCSEDKVRLGVVKIRGIGGCFWVVAA